MQQSRCIAILMAFLPVLACAQQPDPPVAPSRTDPAPTRVNVYYGGPGVTLPTLLTVAKSAPSAGKCRNKQDVRVRLSLLVDSQGLAQNVFFDRPVGNPLDELALRVIENDRFQPGTYQGAPSAVGIEAEVHMQACVERSKNSSGKEVATLRLRSEPEQKLEASSQPEQKVFLGGQKDSGLLQKVGGNVTPPRAIFQPVAEFSDYARQKKVQGTCVLSLKVDAHGMPQDIHVARTLEASLDQKAVEAVQRYRFTPAMKDGTPVPVAIAIEVRFKLY